MSDKATRFAELQAARADALAARLHAFVALRGDERALDVGTGTGALALALAARVREVVALDADAAMLAPLRAAAPANVEVVEGDAERLPFEDATFDFVGTLRTLHHVHRPELALAELARVVRPGGTLLVVDQLAPSDPLDAIALNRFEQARDASTTRVLADVDLRGLFDANGLVLRRGEVVREPRELDAYLDLAGCAGDERERARALVPAAYAAVLGWYLLTRS